MHCDMPTDLSCSGICWVLPARLLQALHEALTPVHSGDQAI